MKTFYPISEAFQCPNCGVQLQYGIGKNAFAGIGYDHTLLECSNCKADVTEAWKKDCGKKGGGK